MKFAVLGTGAVGGFYGSKLQQAGYEMHFLLHQDFEYVREYGLTVISKDGDFALPKVNAYAAVEQMPPCDVVLVALKTTQNHLLPQLLAAVLKPEGVVVMLQNGLGIEETAAQIVGAERVLGGLCFLCANKTAPGQILHLDQGRLTLGEFQKPGVSPRLTYLAAIFQNAGVPVVCAENLQTARWQKLLWNMPFNGLSVVLNATTAQLMTQSRPLVETLMQEVLTLAEATGYPLPTTALSAMLAATDQMLPYQTSMKLDYDARRPLELEAIYGYPLRRAQAHDQAAPQLTMLYQQLQFLNAY